MTIGILDLEGDGKTAEVDLRELAGEDRVFPLDLESHRGESPPPENAQQVAHSVHGDAAMTAPASP